MINLSGVENNEDLLSRVMTTIHGPLLAGDTLVKALGYSSSEALRQAAFRNTVPVTLMDLPTRKLKFALSAEVALWLVQQRTVNCEKPFGFVIDPVKLRSDSLKLFILNRGYLLDENDLMDLSGVTSRNDLIVQDGLGRSPFGVFRIDNRRNKLFALSIEAFSHFI